MKREREADRKEREVLLKLTFLGKRTYEVVSYQVRKLTMKKRWYTTVQCYVTVNIKH